MRSPILFSLLLSSFFVAVFAYGWSKEDHEIFRLRDELELTEGEDITFYDFIGVKTGPSVALDDINKAYRKTSSRIHPDKFKADKSLSRSQAAAARKKASERFARLGLIDNILRGPGRDRYDHFLRNGFPKWRGTGYYYARFRPGLGSVLFGVYLLAGVAHYVVLKMNRTKQREFMMKVIREARQAAWGSSAGVAGLDTALGESTGSEEAKGNRKERRAAAKRKGGATTAVAAETNSGSATPVSQARKKVVGPTGKTFIVDAAGNVYLVDETEEGDTRELLLDPREVKGAAWGDTLLLGLPRGIWRMTGGRFVGKKETIEADGDEETSNGNASPPRANVQTRAAKRKAQRRG